MLRPLLAAILLCSLQLVAAQSTPPPSAKAASANSARLFALVDPISRFASEQTGLPLNHPIHRAVTTRAQVQVYLQKKLAEDKSTERLEQSELLLKKFGFLDPGFDLRPFLVDLLKEQIEAYYDPHTKTIHMLDWVSPDDQQTVLAHELTHAVQDQHVDLEHWSDHAPSRIPSRLAEDHAAIVNDELDSARDAIVEGQATAIMLQYQIQPQGLSLDRAPELLDQFDEAEDGSVLARAPLYLSTSLLFSYRAGLRFVQYVWQHDGRDAAFRGLLDQPPTSTWQLMNPASFEQHVHIPVPLLADLHPLTDPEYAPLDVGQIGALDLHVLTTLAGGDLASQRFTPAWRGGIYWAGQRRSARTAAERHSTASIAYLYLSNWKDESTARAFAELYADWLSRKSTSAAKFTEQPNDGPARIFRTSEGPARIEQRGTLVFVSEGFSDQLAERLSALEFDAQGSGPVRLASIQPAAPLGQPLTRMIHSLGVTRAELTAVEQRVGGRASQQVGKSARQQASKSASQQVSESASQRVGKSASRQAPPIPLAQLTRRPLTTTTDHRPLTY